MQSLILSTVTVILLVSSTVYGNTLGTGSCEAGISAIESTTNPTNTHINYAGFPGATLDRPGGKASFSDSQVQVSLDGSFLVSDFVRTFLPNTDLVWEVTSASTPFKGIFFRVEKESDDFTNVGNDATTLQNVILCDTFPGVVGVTQLPNSGLMSAAGTLNFPTGGNVTIDVTLVFNNVAESRYAFESYPIFIQVLSEPPVEAPVAVPVDIPVAVPTDTPVAVPVAVPVEAPVVVPVEAPVVAPVGAPTEEPVEAPVEAPVDAPTEEPVEAPVEKPVKAPVAKAPVAKAPVAKAGKGMEGKVKGMKMNKEGKEKKGEKEGKDKKGAKEKKAGKEKKRLR